MTQWINPLDRVPQIPQDWANHISQGGLWSCLVLAILAIWLPVHEAAQHALIGMTIVAVGKKVVDYVKESEPAWMCVGKAIVTIFWPLSLWLITL
ncbi:MAG: hypothetical protein P4L87_25230 [Formivibrio sp.]|nr:hypothetical protein [Formivibrio sp.]